MVEINKYNNSIIYKITDTNETDIYIGSTIQQLKNRFTAHKATYKNWLITNNVKLYCTSFILFNKYGLDNCKIEIIEAYNCNSRLELVKQEGIYAKNINCVNIRIAGRTRREYRIDNKENIKQNRLNNKENIKQYNIINKDKLAEQGRQYNIINKERLREVRKQYRINNKEIIAIKKKLYVTNNLDKATERYKQYYIINKVRIALRNKDKYIADKLKKQNLEEINE